MNKNGPENIGGISFKELVELHQQRVIGICFRFTSNLQDSEDLAQEVFIEIFNSIDAFRSESDISTWIHRIAVNKSLDSIRRKNRKKRFAIFKFSEVEDIPDIAATNTPGTIFENEERKKMLQKALDSLPEKQRAAITLSKIQDMTSKEIAVILNTSAVNVDSLIYRAKQNMRVKLYKFYKDSL